MANLKPLGDKAVIKVTEAEDKTASGIFLPDSAKKKPQEGEVVALLLLDDLADPVVHYVR